MGLLNFSDGDNGDGGNADPLRMGEKGAADDRAERATRMALSAVKKYGPAQAKVAASVIERSPQAMKMVGKVGKRAKYIRTFMCCGGGCCFPLLVLVILLAAVL